MEHGWKQEDMAAGPGLLEVGDRSGDVLVVSSAVFLLGLGSALGEAVLAKGLPG